MQYKISYIPPKNYTIAGFGVMFNEVIYELFCIDEDTNENVNYYIDWTNKNILYYDKNIGDNVWNYYFYNNNLETIHTNYTEFYQSGRNITTEYKYHINMNIDKIIDKNKIEYLHKIYKKYISIRTEINDSINEYVTQNLIGKTLGIQYRYTDKVTEVNQISPTKLINHLLGIIDNYDTFYVATDYQPLVDELTKLSTKFKFNECCRSNNYVGSHFIKNDRKYDNYLKGYECLFDIIVLSKCNDYYYSRSNISLIPIIMNNRSYEYIKLVNDL